jgi:hypothetical protein
MTEVRGDARQGGGVDSGCLASIRLKRGECATCGTRLFELLGGTLHHCTTPGQILEGRCLICYPLDVMEKKRIANGESLHEGGNSSIPAILDADDDSVVSAMSMGTSYYDGGADDSTIVSHISLNLSARSGPGAFKRDPAPDARPMMPRRREPSSRRLVPPRIAETLSSLNEEELRLHQEDKRPQTTVRPKLSYRSKSEKTFASLGDDDDDSDEFFLEDESPMITEIKAKEPTRNLRMQFLRRAPSQRVKLADVAAAVAAGWVAAPIPGPPCYQPDAEEHTEEHNEPCHEDVASLLRQLENTSGAERFELLQSLTACIWKLGGPAKETFCDANGVESLAMLLWGDMNNLPVVQETCRLVLALAANSKNEPRDFHVFTHAGTEGLVDALLISMQTLLRDEFLQELGCRIFACLARASQHNEDINDGTLSGAVQSVLNVMDAYPDSTSLQEWGVRALHNQCVYSKNDEANQKALASAVLDSGARASAVLGRLLATNCAVERCSKLFWVLSANIEVAVLLAPEPSVLHEMNRLLREFHEREGVVQLQEALLGSLSNFWDRNNKIDGTELATFVLDTMRFYESEIDILREACFLLTALVENANLSEGIAVGGVRVIHRAMLAFRNDEVFLETALRAQVALSLQSAAAKAALCEPAALFSIFNMCRSKQDAETCQEMCCTLLASLFAAETRHRRATQTKAIEYLCSVMHAYPGSEGIQDAGSGAIRNLSCFPDCASSLAKTIKILMDAIRTFADVTTIHSNACCTLWNLQIFTEDEKDLLSGEDICCIVTTLENHLQDKDVAHMACGALWSHVHESDACKIALIEMDGGIDLVASVLIVHPDSVSILESAFGILTSLTVHRDMMEDVLQSEGFTNVVDVMSRGGNVAVLESGSVFLRNICLAFPEFADEAVNVIPAIIEAMKIHEEDAYFQREACSFLWLVASQSSNIKSEIMSLGGVSLLMKILDLYRGDELVEEAALGAYRELTQSTP